MARIKFHFDFNEDAEPVEEPTEQPEAEGKKVILVTSFGTSYEDTRELTIGGIEQAITAAYPDYEVRRAFTAQIVIDILAERDGIEVDNVTEALDKLVADGVTELVVQPTHLMNGYEYDDIVAEVKKYQDKFGKLSIGAPLLTSDADFAAVVDTITKETASYNTDGTAVLFMGHGTHHNANAVYAKMKGLLDSAGYENYFVGVVEGTPMIDEVLPELEAGGYKKVVMQPLMVVAGDHANNDMAGEEEDSWKSILEAAGFETESILNGLGQFADIQKIYVQHVQDAIDNLAAGSNLTVVPQGSAGAPVTELQAGTYPISVESSSSMFKVVDAQLTAKGGEMTAVLTLSGTGYGKLYMGTIEEAEADTDENTIPFVEDADGAYTYEVPVEALDADIDVAAWSIRKEQWYDRVLVFDSSSLPAEAFAA